APTKISGAVAAGWRARLRRKIVEESAAPGQTCAGGDLAAVALTARAPLVLHADSRVGSRRAAGATQPHLPRRAALDGRHRRAAQARREIHSGSDQTRGRIVGTLPRLQFSEIISSVDQSAQVLAPVADESSWALWSAQLLISDSSSEGSVPQSSA